MTGYPCDIALLHVIVIFCKNLSHLFCLIKKYSIQTRVYTWFFCTPWEHHEGPKDLCQNAEVHGLMYADWHHPGSLRAPKSEKKATTEIFILFYFFFYHEGSLGIILEKLRRQVLRIKDQTEAIKQADESNHQLSWNTHFEKCVPHNIKKREEGEQVKEWKMEIRNNLKFIPSIAWWVLIKSAEYIQRKPTYDAIDDTHLLQTVYIAHSSAPFNSLFLTFFFMIYFSRRIL